jgi:hypothetical protein
MSGLSGVNLGSILTVLVNLTSGSILAYLSSLPTILTAVSVMVGNWVSSLSLYCLSLSWQGTYDSLF